MEEKSLLARLMDRFTAVCHNKSSQIKKSVIALTLAIGTVLSVSACSPTDLGNTPGGIIGGITNPGSGIGQDGERHSQLFFNVINTFENKPEDYEYSQKSKEKYKNPCAFLESQGFYPEQCVLNSDILYFEEDQNNMYVALIVSPEHEDYQVHYLLKYSLTNLEISDFLSIVKYDHSSFFLYELDKIQQPEILSTVRVDTASYEETKNDIATSFPPHNSGKSGILNHIDTQDLVKDANSVSLQLLLIGNYTDNQPIDGLPQKDEVQALVYFPRFKTVALSKYDKTPLRKITLYPQGNIDARGIIDLGSVFVGWNHYDNIPTNYGILHSWDEYKSKYKSYSDWKEEYSAENTK